MFKKYVESDKYKVEKLIL